MSELSNEEDKAETSEKKERPAHYFKPGVSGNPAGRPKGSFSIKSRIISYLEDHPEELGELIKYYTKEKKMRDLLWRMIDGNPSQQSDITSGGKPIPILGNVSVNDSNAEDSKPE